MSWGTIEETDARSARTKQENPSTAKRPLLKIIFAVGLVVFGALAFWGIIIRRSSNQELEKRSNQAAEIVVNVIHPQKTAEKVPLTLPGETKAYVEAPIYAQTSGYLKKWYFDIGSRIKAGEVLAADRYSGSRPTAATISGKLEASTGTARPIALDL